MIARSYRFCQIGKLLANARRMRQARQTAQPAGHLAIMVAVRKRGRRLARCQSRQPAGMQKWRGGDNKFIAALPAPANTEYRFHRSSRSNASCAECSELLARILKEFQMRTSLKIRNRR
jgi:DNA-directed RNA polymerase beta' subunit